MVQPSGNDASKTLNKRKQPPSSGPDRSNGRQKRQKLQRDARVLVSQTAAKAYKNGELDVSSFVKAREFEIKSIEQGLLRSKKALTTRAFQQVPKELRRRTASHNAKRVPKRLRKRAQKEMVEDNTPTTTSRKRTPTRQMRLRMETVKQLRALGSKNAQARKSKGVLSKDTKTSLLPRNSASKAKVARSKVNRLSQPPVPPAKFRKRQVHKTWLPTHLYHAKRAHMTPPREPLWRFALPMTSTAKSYRPTHRASTERGAIAWDTSYMSTIGLQGSELGIQSVLKALGVGKHGAGETIWLKSGQRWRDGTRTWQGWLFEDTVDSSPMAPVTVIWCASQQTAIEQTKSAEPAKKITKKPQRQVMIRVHPSAFSQVWEQVTRAAKKQQPQVKAEDLRFELGSIEILGPDAMEALQAALWPPKTKNGDVEETDSMDNIWPRLKGVTNPSVLPPNALLALNITDPRLHHPPRKSQIPSLQEQEALFDTLAQWPCDSSQVPSGLFDRSKRLAACRLMQSQKAINRRKAAASPGSFPDPRPEDPQIPVLLLTSPCDPSDAKAKRKSTTIGKQQHKWVLVLPWKAVPAVWQSVMYCPLSTGGQVKLGGLQEQRQVAFENGVSWFPGDFPGTQAGSAWEATESARRKKEWEGRPKGKRTEWDSLRLGPELKGELGEGWSCDWQYLASVQPGYDAAIPIRLLQLTTVYATSKAAAQAQSNGATTTQTCTLATIRIRYLSRGAPKPCARIYSLPTRSPTLNETTLLTWRSHWLSLDPSRKPPNEIKKKERLAITPSLRGIAPSAIKQKLAADLLRPVVSNEEEDYPDCPAKEDLLGFVTSGEFCLSEGRGVAIGSVLYEKMHTSNGKWDKSEDKLCIVRNAGESVGRLAIWDYI